MNGRSRRDCSVVFGEVVDELEECYQKMMATEPENLYTLPYEVWDKSVYHYNPSLEQVREWLHQEKFEIIDAGSVTRSWGNKDLNEAISFTECHFIVS